MERYLKDIINLNDIKAGKINIIQAPCGAGKTTFAIDILLDYFDKQNVLWSIYLIDTRNGRQALNNRFKDGEIFECYQFRQPDIYTYAKFAKDCEDKSGSPSPGFAETVPSALLADNTESCHLFPQDALPYPPESQGMKGHSP